MAFFNFIFFLGQKNNCKNFESELLKRPHSRVNFNHKTIERNISAQNYRQTIKVIV